MACIGLLWDSVSDNMGDQAIGQVLQRAFAGLPYRVIDPFDPNLTDVNTLVIGGGELLRPAGDPFYDVFRVPGAHILNTVGVLDGAQTDYLSDYRLVSVRSQADLARVGQGAVVPCLTLLYNDYLQHTDAIPDIPPGAIGIHITYNFHEQIEPLVNWLRTTDLGPIVWLPITHYNADALLLRELAAYVPHSQVLPSLAPDATFRVIGKLKALVSSSLHAGLFAYAQGVPVLGYAPVRKLAAFLGEREQPVFTLVADIERELPRLLNAPPDLTVWRQRDEANCRQWLARMLAEAENALAAPRQAIQMTPANRTHHQLQMAFHRENGARTALIAHHALQAADLRATRVVRLANQLIWPVTARLRRWIKGKA